MIDDFGWDKRFLCIFMCHDFPGSQCGEDYFGFDSFDEFEKDYDTLNNYYNHIDWIHCMFTVIVIDKLNMTYEFDYVDYYVFMRKAIYFKSFIEGVSPGRIIQGSWFKERESRLLL